MKKALIVTTVASTIDQFLMHHIKLLRDMDYEVHVACNFKNGNNCSDERVEDLKRRLTDLNVSQYPIDFSRRITHISENLKAYKLLRKLVNENKYELVHCHTPIASVCTRLACRKARKKGTKVFYTAHGFHFFNGAPKKNWLVYYPVEKICARFTDTLITINKEDFELAKSKMKAKEVLYIEGIGFDFEKIKNADVDVLEKRRALGIPDGAPLLLSVGELNHNKNHETIIRAIADMENVYYIVAGKGDLQEYLQSVIDGLGMTDRVKLLGFRTDIPELCKTADIFCFPSFREGLGLAAIEAMAAGIPVITSNIHGINDYSIDGQTGFKCDPSDVAGFSTAISKLIADEQLRRQMGDNNKIIAQKYDISRIVKVMEEIYGSAR